MMDLSDLCSRWLPVLAAVVAVSACDGTGGGGDPAAAGQAAVARGELPAAAVFFKSALQKNPADVASRVGLGNVLLQQGDLEGAVVEFARAYEGGADPDRVAPLFARALVELGSYKRVVLTFANTSLKDKTAQATLGVELARAWIYLGEEAKSAAAIQAALVADAGQPMARLMQARLTAFKGETARSATLVDELLQANPGMPEAWQFRGDLYRLMKQEDKAVVAYEKALELRPSFMLAHVALMGARMRVADLPGARKQLERMEKSAPYHPVTALARAEHAYYEGDLKKARELTQALVRTFPDHSGILVLSGTVEAALGSLVQAAAHFGKALGQDPGLNVAREGLAAGEIRQGQAARALVTLRPQLGPDSTSTRALALAGEAYIQLGDPASAEKMFARAAKLRPQETKLQAAALSARMLGGDSGAALGELRQLADRSKDVEAELALVAAHLRRREFAQALAVIDQMERKVPGSAMVAEMRGQALRGQGNVKDARAALEESLKRDPARFGALAGLVELDVGAGQLAEATKRLETHIAGGAKSPWPLLLLADLKIRSGAPATEVSKLYADAVREGPLLAEPRIRQIRYSMSRRQYKEALTHSQEALTVLPGDTSILEAAGFAQLRAGDVELAATTFRRLASALPDSPVPFLRLAEVYRTQGRSDQAEVALRKALELAPSDGTVVASLVDLLASGGRREAAFEVARRIRSSQPANPAGYILEAALHDRFRNPAGSVEVLRVGSQRAPGSVITSSLYSALLKTGRDADADRLALDWLTRHPEDSLLEYQVAMRDAERGRMREAEARLRRVVAANPGNAMAANNLASVILANGGNDAARFAQRANELLPDRPQLMDTLAAALAAEGRIAEGLALQRRALDLEPQDLNLKLGLAKLALRSGDKATARAELEALKAAGAGFPRQDEVATLLKGL